MTSVGITKPGESPKTYSLPTTAVFLDSGNTLSHLPKLIVNDIVADFPDATPSGEFYVVPCADRDKPGTVDFGFGKTTIHVQYHDFIKYRGSDCILGVTIDDDAPVLGGR